ncbi:hypothetical protein [Thiohalocapsa marina]|uniref:hypothetical protein n=1 Tax=Thiohalocapsa marina TaxID=424902 RepID=UPI0014781235|nr:hypothetical protein [Thiohalocapsa marina]
MNLAILRHLALSRLKNDGAKLGLQNERLKAGWMSSAWPGSSSRQLIRRASSKH